MDAAPPATPEELDACASLIEDWLVERSRRT